MWILLGLAAIVATLINLYIYIAGKDYKLAMALGLSFTALTLCAEHSLATVILKKLIIFITFYF
ncbi:hypothetical protein ACIQXI_11030 [Lysinibacillus sp. NPDC097195]|uniref:hypothetical protein n=1 Tax=Lysinibacillus sp. NPDC097195 TaxID=3364141 RepID=UPI0038121D44